MPERVEQEGDVRLSDVGPILELTFPDGRRAQIRLSSVDSAPLLKAVIGLVSDVLVPAALAGTMIDGAYAAPTTPKGEPMLQEADLQQYLAEDAAAVAAAQRPTREEARRQAIAQAAREEAAEKARQESLKAQDRQHAIFSSFSRLRADRQKAQAWRQGVTLPTNVLLAQCAVAIHRAVEAAEAAVRAEYAVKIQAVRDEFERQQGKRK